MKREKSKKKTYAQPSMDEVQDETMLPQMMRDFWTSVGRRGIKCE